MKPSYADTRHFERGVRGVVRAGLVALALVMVGACAQVPKDPDALKAYKAANDPFEPANRAIFDFNLALDKGIVKPVAKGYRWALPAFARDSLRNFFDHISSTTTLVNDVLQGKPDRAAETAMRFFVNTTAGMLGFFDVAGQYGMTRHNEDFGQTLAVWGVGQGPYLMIPLVGPHNLRHAVGRAGDVAMDPLVWLAPGVWQYRVAAFTTLGLDVIDRRARTIEALDDTERTSLDFYATVRSLYRQNRESEIRDGRPAPISVPEIVE